MTVGLISHSIAALAFVGLTLLILTSWKRSQVGALLLLACSMTALWAMGVSYNLLSGGLGPSFVALLEVVRSTAWVGYLISLLVLSTGASHLAVLRRLVAPAIGALAVLMLALEILNASLPDHLTAWLALDIGVVGRLVLALVGLLLVENMYRNAAPERRWAIKFLCFGLGGLFAYDFFLYSEALLYQRTNAELYGARGMINAIVVPLIAVSAARNPDWSVDIFVSRRMIFHSTTLVGAGLYLLFMAAAGYYLRRYGGDWGPILQATTLFIAALVLILVVISGRFRASLKVKINQHFFTYKYDYRDEWLRLIRTISSVGSGGGLPVRVIQGVADIVESPEGALWRCERGQRFVLVDGWNVSSWNLPREAPHVTVDHAFTAFLEQRRWVVNLDEAARHPARYEGLVLPGFIAANRRAWLIVPLLHHDRLLGFLLLGHPRAPKELNWEDYDLLKTVGQQAAGYLAEHESAKALALARQFEEFNKRFAFVLHDIKNLVSQLSLMLRNAERHRDNPVFLEDMVQTVSESVDKMNRLLVRLHESGSEARAAAAVDLVPLVGHAIAAKFSGDRKPHLDCGVDRILVAADDDRFAAVLAHVIDNAMEATAAKRGDVRVRLTGQGQSAVIEIEDDGVGMDADFVSNELFKPFKSTKSGGYGIGAYESRQVVEEMGGRLEVSSQPGVGTTVRMILPAIGNQPQPASGLRALEGSQEPG